MLHLRKSEERGKAQMGWLNSAHTFSFGYYYDPNFTGFRNLLVINDDRVAPGAGFDTHPHRDMEIISYVVDGAIKHRDSMGNGALIKAGEVQRMTAGTGVTHSEFNAYKDKSLRFLQIWLPPHTKGLTPSYEQKSFDPDQRRNKLVTLVAPEGEDGGLHIHQDAKIHGSILDAGAKVTYNGNPKRYTWLQMVSGEIEINGQIYAEGDGVYGQLEGPLEISAKKPSDLLIFDLA